MEESSNLSAWKEKHIAKLKILPEDGMENAM